MLGKSTTRPSQRPEPQRLPLRATGGIRIDSVGETRSFLSDKHPSSGQDMPVETKGAYILRKETGTSELKQTAVLKWQCLRSNAAPERRRLSSISQPRPA